MTAKPKSLAPGKLKSGPQRRERIQIRKDSCCVLLATRNEILREGLRSMIAQCGFRVLDCPVTERGLVLDELAARKCGIFVIDGSEDQDFSRTKAFVAQIRERNARGHIVVLIPPHLAHTPDPAVVVEASAIVTTDVTAYVLGNLLQLVSQNYVIRSGNVAIEPPAEKATVIDAAVPSLHLGSLPPIDTRAVAGLSGRESEILLHVVRGSSNKVIARALGIAEATVKIHVKGIFRKIGVANRTQAAFHVFNQGWLGGEEASRREPVVPSPQKNNCFPTGLDIIVPHDVLR